MTPADLPRVDLSPGDDFGSRLAAVRDRIDRACRACGRDPRQVRLLAVSKTHPVGAIDAALAAGCTDFGESKVPELVAKAEHFAADARPRWVMIGHLQTNKIAGIARWADEFHALDSLRVASALQHRLEAADRTLDVWVQVNSSGEATKSGVSSAEAVELASQLSHFDRLRPRGLMTLAANSPDEAVVAGCFERVLAVREQIRDRTSLGYDDLSMGMSTDLEVAIAHGATTIRVGTALFGGRSYPA